MVSFMSKKRKIKKAIHGDDRKIKSQLTQSIARTIEKKNRAIEFAVLADSIGNLEDKFFVLQGRNIKLMGGLADVCGGQTAYKRRMKTIRERWSGVCGRRGQFG